MYLNSSVATRQIFFMDLFRRTSNVMQRYNRFLCFYRKIQRDWSEFNPGLRIKKKEVYLLPYLPTGCVVSNSKVQSLQKT